MVDIALRFCPDIRCFERLQLLLQMAVDLLVCAWVRRKLCTQTSNAVLLWATVKVIK